MLAPAFGCALTALLAVASLCDASSPQASPPAALEPPNPGFPPGPHPEYDAPGNRVPATANAAPGPATESAQDGPAGELAVGSRPVGPESLGAGSGPPEPPNPGHHQSALAALLGSVFPMNSVITYQAPPNGTQVFVARYATFSHILDDPVSAHYRVLSESGCKPFTSAGSDAPYRNKIVVVQRGGCSFTDKVTNVLQLEPKAIIVGNNQPHAPLITMYSDALSDETVRIPVVFASYEDYSMLAADAQLPGENGILTVRTVAMDGVLPLVLSAVLSPPMFVLLFFLLIRSFQYLHRRRVCTLNQQVVKQLPVYIYNGNHLVPAKYFYAYLTATGQTNDLPSVHSSSENLTSGSDTELAPVSTSYVIGGTDLYALYDLELLFADRHFYPTQKCSICLSHFHPLRSRVLVMRCKHYFHENCLSKWLINFRKSCPLCNERLCGPSAFRPDSYGSVADLESGVLGSTSEYSEDSQHVGANGAEFRTDNESRTTDYTIGSRATDSRTESRTGDRSSESRLSQEPTQNHLFSDSLELVYSAPLLSSPCAVSEFGSPASVSSFVTSRSQLDTQSTASSHYITPLTSSNGTSQNITETPQSASSRSTIRPGSSD